MVYLDYSATTPINNEVLDTFIKVSKNYFANPNSHYNIALSSNELIESATKQISEILKVKTSEIIYTSGASESNNMAIKGVCENYQSRGKKIITTKLELSSIVSPLSYLQDKGFDIEFIKLKADGQIDLELLEEMLSDEVLLVTICAVDSELGIRQPVEKIATMLKKYPKIIFHVDMTQCLGKDNIDLQDIDLASFSAHKIYGFKGIGGLIKKEHIQLVPLIHGGKSTTIYRSGTPATSLIASCSKALRLIMENFEEKHALVSKYNNDIRNFLKQFSKVVINSTDKSIPHILNFSILGIKPETFLHALEKDSIYISTKSACSSDNSLSTSVLALTNNKEISSASLRISLSYLTTDEEITIFKKSFKENYYNLIGVSNENSNN